MQNKKRKQKKLPKFRLLLDAPFAKPQEFRKLYKKAVLKHIRHDLHLAPTTEDQQIYSVATQKEMFVVTFDSDFRRLVRKSSSGVFMVDSGLSNDQIDKNLSGFVAGKNPKDYSGKIIKIK